MKFETAFRNYRPEFRQLCTTIIEYTEKSLFTREVMGGNVFVWVVVYFARILNSDIS